MKKMEIKESKCKTYYYQAYIKYNINSLLLLVFKKRSEGGGAKYYSYNILTHPTFKLLKLSIRAVSLNCLYVLLYSLRFKHHLFLFTNLTYSYAENGSGEGGGQNIIAIIF